MSLERYNHNPKLRIQKVENVNKALNFIHSRGVNLTNIGAEVIHTKSFSGMDIAAVLLILRFLAFERILWMGTKN